MVLHDLSRRFFRAQGVSVFKGGNTDNKNGKKRRAGTWLVALAAAVTLSASSASLSDEFNTRATRTSHPQTEHSRYIADLQARYGNLPGHLKTAIVDTDKIRAELAARGEDADDITAGEAALIEQAREQTGREISGEMSFYIYKTLAKEHPEAFQMRLDDVVGRFGERNEMCVVTTMSPDHTDKSANRYVYFQHPSVYGALSEKDPLTGFSRDHLRRYTDLHEIAHCLDERNERSLANGDAVRKMEGLFTQHKSDAFADVLAGLLMARDGEGDALSRRAMMRAVNSHMVGPYLGRLGSKGFQDKYLQHAGAIYTLQRPLNAAQEWVDGLPPGELARMSTQDLIDKAHEIVDLHALSKAEFNDISAWHMSPDYLDGLKKMAARDAEYRERLEKLQAYIGAGAAATRAVFGLGPDDALPEPDFTQELSPLGPFDFTSEAERLALTRAAGREIAQELGARPATPDNLMAAYIRTADRLRRTLDETPGTQQNRTTRGMLVQLPEALRHSRDFIKPETPRLPGPKSRSHPVHSR